MNVFYQTVLVEEKDVSFTILNPDTFTGSAFRENSLIKGAALEERKKMTV